MSIIVQKVISILVAALIYIALNLHFVAFVDVKNSTFDVRRLVTENVEVKLLVCFAKANAAQNKLIRTGK